MDDGHRGVPCRAHEVLVLAGACHVSKIVITASEDRVEIASCFARDPGAFRHLPCTSYTAAVRSMSATA